jgi:hypothetical protein
MPKIAPRRKPTNFTATATAESPKSEIQIDGPAPKGVRTPRGAGLRLCLKDARNGESTMREACLSDIAAEFVSIMEVNPNEAHGLLDRLLTRQPRELPKSGRKRQRPSHARGGGKAERTSLT